MNDTRKTGYQIGFPDELREKEIQQIWIRRRSVDPSVQTSGGNGAGLPEDTLGVALSGGGIRSATFCLGVFQSLGEHKWLRKVDYVSTVSGGGYFGGFLGRWFNRFPEKGGIPNKTFGNGSSERVDSTQNTEKGQRPIDEIETALGNCHSKPISWLRENGRYISPNGAGDSWMAAVSYVRSWVGLQFVLSLFILTIFLFSNSVRASLCSNVWWYYLEHFVALRAHSLPLLSPEMKFWWSPYIVLPVTALLVFVIPIGAAFWLTQTRKRNFGNLVVALTGLVGGAVCAYFTWPRLGHFAQSCDFGELSQVTKFSLVVSVVSALAILFWGIVSIHSKREDPDNHAKFARNLLTKWLSWSAFVTVVLMGITVIDSLGQTAWFYYEQAPSPSYVFGGGSFLMVMVALLQKFAAFLGRPAGRRMIVRLPMAVLLTGIAVLIVVALLVFWSAVSYTLWLHPRTPNVLFLSFALMLGCSLALSRCMSFLNLSSQQQLYSARLVRAYLGASNPIRWTPDGRTVSDVVQGDDINLEQYRPQDNGGPLHIINVTVNETLGGRSQVEQRDRKGLPMSLGPCGVSVGIRYHALWKDSDKDARVSCIQPLRKDQSSFHLLATAGQDDHAVERLSLGDWTAISGAAFSTGLGARTNIGLSILFGLANVRLGYWWDSHINPDRRGGRASPSTPAKIGERFNWLFPVQTHLLDELLARFHGPARRRWYLSDGGHFENTACYELLRRRVPLINCCDDGQDLEYNFEDGGGLVRKARLDFDAEIQFLSSDEISQNFDLETQKYIGTLDELRRVDEAGYSQKHAAGAWVCYDGCDQPTSFLLLIKPGLTGDEPLDVLHYHKANPKFPQEPTSDQYFDEAQWESYRRLGKHIGDALFSQAKSPRWIPSKMKRNESSEENRLPLSKSEQPTQRGAS